MVNKVCPICGTHFETNGPRKYCSNECSQKAFKVSLKRSHEKLKLKRAEEARVRREAKRLKRDEDERLRAEARKRVCLSCGLEFSTSKKNQISCSERCYNKAYKEKKRQNKARRNALAEKPAALLLNCHTCGVEFETIHETKRYCSKPCRKKADRHRNRSSSHHKARKAISGRLREVLYRKGLNKTNSVMKYVGCSTLEFVEHLSSQMTDEMTWESYGVFGWHIDHIVPCAAFDLTIEDHRYLCFDKANLRPLWHSDNIAKSHELSECDIESLDSKYLERLVGAGIVEKCNDKWRVVRHAAVQ